MPTYGQVYLKHARHSSEYGSVDILRPVGGAHHHDVTVGIRDQQKLMNCVFIITVASWSVDDRDRRNESGENTQVATSCTGKHRQVGLAHKSLSEMWR